MRLVMSTKATANAYRLLRQSTISHRSQLDNVYYCCLQKSGSQWLRWVLGDPIVYRRSGLDVLPISLFGLNTVESLEQFPRRTIVAHLYVNYETYLTIPKSESFRTFFVGRDPRDVVVSWYHGARFSNMRYTAEELAPTLERLDQQAGMRYLIERLGSWGYFDAARSWATRGPLDPLVLMMTYEQLTSAPEIHLKKLLDWMDISIPNRSLGTLIDRHRFSAYADGRSRGVENAQSHYRRGVAGDWKNHFDEVTLDLFYDITGDLVSLLGYGR
jgi:hypothetical protein